MHVGRNQDAPIGHAYWMEPGRLYTLIQELRRRTVFREIIVYGATTLILLETGDIVFESFGRQSVPLWYYLVLGAGFLFSLWFSWYYDITPDGIKKTPSDEVPEAPATSKKLKTYKITTFASVFIILGLVTFWIIDRARTRQIEQIEKSFAVLPYAEEEMKPNETEIFEFAGSEITTQLVKIEEYRVVPWEDTRKYKRGEKSFARMGQELSVSLLVNWNHYNLDKRQFLHVALIHAEDNQLIWSENYKIRRSWSSEICRRSRQIAKGIYRKLKTSGPRTEWASLNEQPRSSQATMLASLGRSMTYNAWDQATIQTEFTDESKSGYTDSLSFEKAIGYFDRAINEDPTQASYYAYRAKARIWGIRAGFFDPDDLGQCELDIIEAFKLEGESVEAFVALGFYYYFGLSELGLALNAFNKVVELDPENIEYIYYLSRIQSALGNWEKARVLTNRVYKTNPRNALLCTNLGITYHFLKEYNRSLECQDRAINLIPNWYAPYYNKIKTLMALGDLDESRNVAVTAEVHSGISFKRVQAEIDMYQGNYSFAAERIESLSNSDFRHFGETEGDGYLAKAKIHYHAGNLTQAKSCFERAAEYFNTLTMVKPDDPFLLSKLGYAYAGLGMDSRALVLGEKAISALEKQTEAMLSPYVWYSLLQIYVYTGNRQKAIQLKDKLLSMKSYFTETLLRLDPDTKNLFTGTGS